MNVVKRVARLLLHSVILCVSCNSVISAEQKIAVKEVRLAALQARLNERSNDTLYVVNFWATWCKPCIEELPSFQQLTKLPLGVPVKLILVSLDSPKDLQAKVVPFVERRAFDAEIYLLNEAKPNTWIDKIDSSWSGAIPATILFKGEKREFFEQEFSFVELQSTIKQFLE